MKIASFDGHRVGVVVVEDAVLDVTATLPDFPTHLPAQRVNWLIGHWVDAAPAIRDAVRIEIEKVGAMQLQVAEHDAVSPRPY